MKKLKTDTAPDKEIAKGTKRSRQSGSRGQSSWKKVNIFCCNTVFRQTLLLRKSQ